MADQKASPATIDDYIARCPADARPILNELRAVIHAAAPQAVETISYLMPAFAQNGILVWFSLRKDYIGFYPKGSGVTAFQGELSAYKVTKGSIHFPLNRPMPHDLITRIVKYRLAENLKK